MESLVLVLACAVLLLVVMPVLLYLVGRFIHTSIGPGRAVRSLRPKGSDVPAWIRNGPYPGKGYLWRKGS